MTNDFSFIDREHFRSTPKQKVLDTFTLGSGAITSMATLRLNGDLAVMAGACCHQSAEYNRPGELQFICRESKQSLKVDGHFTDPLNRRTVSSVKTHGDTFVSAGYDGCLCGWSFIDGQLERVFRAALSSKPILDFSPVGNGRFVYGTPGQLAICTVDADSNAAPFETIFTLPWTPKPGVNSVDRVHAISEKDVLALIGLHAASRTGRLEVWDVESLVLKATITSMHGLSAMALSDQLTAVASGSVLDSMIGDGQVHLHTLLGGSYSPAFTISTAHLDVDAMCFSPDGRFLAIGDARDHRWSVWDCCFPKAPLVMAGQCRTGDGICDDTLSLAFSPDGVYLYAGGHDAQLYKVPLGNASPCQVTPVASSITSIVVDDYDLVIVGTEGGHVHFIGW